MINSRSKISTLTNILKRIVFGFSTIIICFTIYTSFINDAGFPGEDDFGKKEMIQGDFDQEDENEERDFEDFIHSFHSKIITSLDTYSPNDFFYTCSKITVHLETVSPPPEHL